MSYIESNDILINIYKYRMQKISYECLDISQEAIRIWNRHFIGRVDYTFNPIGYMEPIELVEYTMQDGIEYPLANLFFQEKDYPYILYSKQCKGWYAWFHIAGVKDKEIILTSTLADELYMLVDMYSDMIDITPVNADIIVECDSDNDTCATILQFLRYGIGLISRSSYYYPRNYITLQPYLNHENMVVEGKWSNGDIVACSYDTLMERVKNDIPDVFSEIVLDDYCFIAGGWLSRRSINDQYYLSHDNVYDSYDIDLFIVRGKNDGYTKLMEVVHILSDHGYRICKYGKTLLATKIREVSIQIYPVNYCSILDIIDNFDTSCTSIAYNGSELFASNNYKKYIRYGASYCKFDHMRYGRYRKYLDRGYMLVFDKEYVITGINNHTCIEEQEPNYTTCFDDNLFSMNNPNKIHGTYEPYCSGSWLNRFMPKDYYNEEQSKLAATFCNKLADGYFVNEVCTEEQYNDIIGDNFIGHSSIDYTIKTYNTSYPYYLVTGLKNDIAMELFVRLFTYDTGIIVEQL